MVVRGSKAPTLAFTLEDMPKRPGWRLARFYENARQVTVSQDDEAEETETQTLWEYDEYKLELRNTGNLQADIERSYSSYMAQAKAAEEAKTADTRMRQEAAQARADIDYISAMTGVELV